MAKKVQVTSVTPKATVKATSKAKQASTRKLVGNIAAATMVGAAVRDIALLAKGVKAGRNAISSTKAAEAARLAKAAKEKPYAKTYKGKQGVNSDTTIKVKGTPKQTVETGAKVEFKKVIEPNAPKTIRGRENRSGQRVTSVVKNVEKDVKRLKGNVKRSTPGAGAAVVAVTSNKKKDKK
jgi:hypothetical protein